MTKMLLRQAALASLSLSLFAGLAQAATIYTVATGFGSDPDQATADSQAQQAAANNANETCPGVVENTTITSDNCSPITSGADTVYACSVVMRVQCQAGR